MSPSDNGSNASAFVVLTAGDQGSCQVIGPRPLPLGCTWRWERGSKSGSGDPSLGELGKAGQEGGCAVGHSSLKLDRSSHKGGPSLCIRLCCFFPCMIAFYFHCICFSFLLENVLRRGEFSCFWRLSIICSIFAYTACLLSISFTIPCLSLPVEKSETIGSISSFFSVSCVHPLKDLFFKTINCFCPLLRAVMVSKSPGVCG